MPKLIWSEPALHDLRAIEQFLSNVDPLAALRILRAIRGAAAGLETFPRLGSLLEQEHRSLRIRATSYVMIYAVKTDGLHVLRMRHVREDWRSQ